MKKLILSVFILSALLVSGSPALAADELWSRGTNEYKVQREGNSIVLTNTNPKVPRDAGISSLVGTINGTTFTGKQYLHADGCPNLEGYVPASGTVSADGNSISVTFTSNDFYTASCTIKRSFEVSYTYTKVSAANTSPSPSPPVAAPTGKDCWREFDDATQTCLYAHTECITNCPQGSNNIERNKVCLESCTSAYKICNDRATAVYDACVALQKQGATKKLVPSELKEATDNKQSEKPSVGVSSRDFRALAKANAEYEKAQADLEKVKESNDPGYEAKKDFVSEYNAAFKGNEKLKTDLEVLRSDLETIHELVSKAKDFSEIEETVESIKKGGIGDYGKLDFFTDAVKGFNKYQDLRASGVSVKDATTKSTLDTYGTSALTLIPVLKAIDLVATTPDFILKTFGINENNWSRKYVTNGFIGKFAPSGVVEQTTNLMVEDNWSDIGNALAYGWGKVQSAEGILDTTYEAGKLLAGTIGAVPVAIAQGISDVVGGGIALGEKAISFVSGWFTSPN